MVYCLWTIQKAERILSALQSSRNSDHAVLSFLTLPGFIEKMMFNLWMFLFCACRTRAHVCVCAHARARARVCVCVWYIYIYIYIYMCVCLCLCVCLYVCMYVYARARMHACVFGFFFLFFFLLREKIMHKPGYLSEHRYCLYVCLFNYSSFFYVFVCFFLCVCVVGFFFGGCLFLFNSFVW